ncbi:MAG: hypothetical protein QG628_707 [Patescibacteria group bacterium]|jgi:hypothetical protein|nr:hypothetical protein [Patescibacteria group bacterium]
MAQEKDRRYLFHEVIDNPHDARKSPWHVVVSPLFPERVAVINPNGSLAARAELDELLESPEITLLGRSDQTIVLPQDVIGRVADVIDYVPEPVAPKSANPFSEY